MLTLFASTRSAPSTRNGRTLTTTLREAIYPIGILAVVMVALQAINSLTGYYLTNHFGITPRTGDGLLGIVLAPMLHGSWGHLWSNLALVVVLGFLVMLGGARQFCAVTGTIWLVSGLGVWLTAPPRTVTIGASVLVFGWLAYLVLRGFLARSFVQILIGLVLLALWGGIFWTGIAQAAFGSSGVSWQGHLFGALGGALAAYLVARADGMLPGPRGRRAARLR